MHLHEDWMLEDRVREIESEDVAKEAKAVAHCAIFAAEGVIGGEIEYNVLFP